jgi:hypothetical protein
MLSLTPSRPACRNEPGTLATIGVDYHQHPAQKIHPNDYKAGLTLGIGIFTPERVFILKDAHRIGEIDIMPAEVGSRFVRVSFVIHAANVHTYVHIYKHAHVYTHVCVDTYRSPLVLTGDMHAIGTGRLRKSTVRVFWRHRADRT